MSIFTDWIKQEMKDRNWRIRDLADESKISPSGISLLLAGKRKPGNEICKGIALAFELPLDYVMIMAGILEPSNPDKSTNISDEVLWNLIKILPPEKRIEASWYVRNLYTRGSEGQQPETDAEEPGRR